MRAPASSPAPLFERYQNVILIAAALVVMVGVVVMLWGRPDPAVVTIVPAPPTTIPSLTPIPSVTPTPGPYQVYVTGAVATSEVVVRVPFGSRVNDLLVEVGGAQPDADLSAVNLAAILEDGDHVHVPTLDSSMRVARGQVMIVTPTPGMLTVYVTGAIQTPTSMLNLPAGSRVQDAIMGAGGFATGADLEAVNLSQVLSDGDMIFVPLVGQSALTTPTPNHPLWVHINYADGPELERLPGIGPALADAIVTYREANGPFLTVDDLDKVPGIGPATLDTLRELVVLD